MKAQVMFGGPVPRTWVLRESARGTSVVIRIPPLGSMDVYRQLGVLPGAYPRKESRV